MIVDRGNIKAMAQGIVGAIGEFDDAQRRVGLTLLEVMSGSTISPRDLEPLEPPALAAALPDGGARNQFMHLLVLFELMANPVSANLERTTEEYGAALGIEPPLLAATRRLVSEQYVLAYWDLARNSYYVKHTLLDSVHGQLYDRLRSEIAYLGIPDRAIARRWRALGDSPDGTWGLEVDRFYDRNNFPRPGEPHGIYELGACHDWVHALTGYDTDPIGELKVFGFIAANMNEPRGFTMLAVTLGLFQTGTITHMHGMRVAIATADALTPPSAAEGFAKAISLGLRCPTDVMGDLDFFALADRPLHDLRAELGLPIDGIE